MTTDPAPRLHDPDEAFDRLAEWRDEYERLMARRDPLVRAALSGPLAGHGGVRKTERASGLTAQTLRRIMARDDIPAPPPDGLADDVDWDSYADHLETLGAALRERLAALPVPAGGRVFTADDLLAQLLLDLAQRVRDTELSDHGYWRLTVELRHEAAATGPAVPEDGWTEPAGPAADRAVRARLCRRVADQITAYRTEGPVAARHLEGKEGR
ncbi:hypothetical protein [Streptomyces tsukubensis]|uniref:hypothetical protein n=1 Tax=Streptomyces tsukubensis TaxID=83656 RepID=UPI00344B812C